MGGKEISINGSPEVVAGRLFLSALEEQGMTLHGPQGEVSEREAGDLLFKFTEKTKQELGVHSLTVDPNFVARALRRFLKEKDIL